MIEKMQMVCLMCKKPMPEISLKTMEEISYTHYSYCEKCLRKGLVLLRKEEEQMTAEKKCEVCKGLLDWAKTTNDDVLYMEERIYAVKMPDGMVTLVRANNPLEAIAKARRTICMTQTGNGGTQIGYVHELKM